VSAPDLAGRRVRLVRTTDEHTSLRPGAVGTVSLVDSVGTIHVRWDDGSTLGLIPGEDSFTVLPTDEQEARA
jgi:Domain of unknown function (DUF4314)